MATDLYRKEVIKPGDQASRIAKDVCCQSHGNCPAAYVIAHQPGNFRGPVSHCWQPWILSQMAKNESPERWVMAQSTENDGAGGKPQFFALLGDEEVFARLGWEIITMVADDFARSGRLPAIIDNDVNVKHLNEQNIHLFEAMMRGYGEALSQAGLINITGEVAVMKHSVTAFCDDGSGTQLILNWGGSCLGLTRKSLFIDGSAIKPGMPIVGLPEPGYRCNGGTFFTELLFEKFGSVEEILASEEARKFVRKLTVPSKSYARFICDLVGWVPDGTVKAPIGEVVGCAHVTGGGIWGKLADILPAGVGVELDNMPKPASVLLEAQEMSAGTSLELSDLQAHGTFHGGCGMLVVCQDPDSVCRKAREEFGIQSQVVGRTTVSEENEIIIESQFCQGRTLSSKELKG